MKKVILGYDDIDRHGRKCNCGLCNASGNSYGVGIYDFTCDCEGKDPDCQHDVMLDSCPEPIKRVYAASEEAAFIEAENLCKKRGYSIVFRR